MAFLVTGDVWQLRIACYTPNQASINTVNFRVTAHAGTGTQDTTAATYLDGIIAGPYKDILSDDAKYRGCSVWRLLPHPGTVPAFTTINDGAGGVAGEMMPTQVSGIISVRTEFAGRAFRGRFYAAFPGEGSNEVPGLPTNAYVAALQVLANTIFQSHTIGGAPNTSTLKPILWHRGDETGTDITTAAAKQLWATQRKRGSYGRINLPPF